MKLVWDGMEFESDDFEFKGGILYVDGHAVADFKEPVVRIQCDGLQATIKSDKHVVINGPAQNCNISGDCIIINGDGMKDCILNGDKIIQNGRAEESPINIEEVAQEIFDKNIGINQELMYAQITQEDVINCIKDALRICERRKRTET